MKNQSTTSIVDKGKRYSLLQSGHSLVLQPSDEASSVTWPLRDAERTYCSATTVFNSFRIESCFMKERRFTYNTYILFADS